MNNNVNVLMCVQVAMLLPEPHQQAYLRCGGQVGYNAFEELVALHLVPVCLEAMVDGVGDGCRTTTLPVPMHIPITGAAPTSKGRQHPPLDRYTTVYCHRAIQVYSPRIQWLEQPWRVIRFEWDNHHTQTPFNFLSVTHASVRKKKGLRTTNEDFSNKFRSVSIEGLETLYTVGIGFLLGSRHLVVLEIPPLINVQIIGCSFMEGCSAITNINLQGLGKLRIIAHSFMYNCESLVSLELQNMHCLTEIGGEFMFGCSSLRTLQLSGLTSIASIGEDFMNGCGELDTLSLTPSSLTTLTSIGDNFLLDCTNVKQNSTILSGLGNVSKVGGQFMWGCNVRGEMVREASRGGMSPAIHEALNDGYTPKRECCVQ